MRVESLRRRGRRNACWTWQRKVADELEEKRQFLWPEELNSRLWRIEERVGADGQGCFHVQLLFCELFRDPAFSSEHSRVFLKHILKHAWCVNRSHH